ncbi:MAG: Asp23/Gls24 family envelope stress response protein [Chlamydiales bacterium]|nr:Asp23/Gls24 family envelope stress response protein [Chlamydiales bacterium]
MKIDTKEFELPDTLFIRDIDSQVFHSIVLQCLTQIEGIHLLEGSLVSSLLGLEEASHVKGIYIEQDQRNHSVNVKVEVNVAYGVPIPKKAEEIQTTISMEITKMTGLHVGAVHVVFKNLYFPDNKREKIIGIEPSSNSDYSDKF